MAPGRRLVRLMRRSAPVQPAPLFPEWNMTSVNASRRMAEYNSEFTGKARRLLCRKTSKETPDEA